MERENRRSEPRQSEDRRVEEAGVRRVGGEEGRRGGHPQSCNLEQLYHESLPMGRALSHSGPPALGGIGRVKGRPKYRNNEVLQNPRGLE